MAYWFHRNPIKATAPVTFELKSMLTRDEARMLCSGLRRRRERLVEKFADARHNVDDLDEDFTKYLQGFAGFIYPFGETSKEKSKLTPVIMFKWTESVLGTTQQVGNTWFEALNICLNMALWLTKHAAWVAAKNEVRENDAKLVHTCLRRAAGIFTFVCSNYSKVSDAQCQSGSDFDPAVLSTYIAQCLAEAQEVAIARAIELEHASSVIAALANDTVRLFQIADSHLEKLDESLFGKWRRYLQLKSELYKAYKYAFSGDYLLSVNKCGDAIRACREGLSHFNIASDFCQKYSAATGPGTSARIERHPFFQRAEHLLKRYLDKAEIQNNLIYHERIPEDCPEIEMKNVYGLVQPQSFELPKGDEIWSARLYASFDLSKSVTPDFSKLQRSKVSLPPVKEAKIYEKEQDSTMLS
ncbi:hypothetical protein AB6A40_006056 [Gnathostoma spinigerum]|uniref:BRO1 domain-containing protein n=1 Tax=Gnathostoma spinigerum TaxID=75299 RepID=A0ABD6EJF8_9BILA